MLNIHIENVGDMTLIECKGTIVGSEEAFGLQKAVTSQEDARIIVLDLTEVDAIGGVGLSTLEALQPWAVDRGIQLKLFNAISSVENTLEHNDAVRFDIASVEEVLALVSAPRFEPQKPPDAEQRRRTEGIDVAGSVNVKQL